MTLTKIEIERRVAKFVEICKEIEEKRKSGELHINKSEALQLAARIMGVRIEHHVRRKPSEPTP